MKRIKTFKLWLLAVIGFLPVASVSAEQTVEVSTFAELEDALEAGNNGIGGRDVTIVLTANIVLTDNINAGHNGNVDRVYTFDFGDYTVDPGGYSIKLPVETKVRVTDPSFFSLFTLANNDTTHKLCYKKDGDYYVAEALVPVVQVTGQEQYFGTLEDAFTYTTGDINLTLLKNVNEGGTITALIEGTKDVYGKVTLTQNNCSIGSTRIYFKKYTMIETDKTLDAVVGPADGVWMSTSNGSNRYTYTFHPCEAQVGTIYYKTFAAAVGEADGATITLVCAVADTYTINNADQVIKVKKDGHSVNVDVSDALSYSGKYISDDTDENTGITTYSVAQGAVATIYYNDNDEDFSDYMSFGDALSGLSVHGADKVIVLLANIGEYVTDDDDPDVFKVYLGDKELTVKSGDPAYYYDTETADGITTFTKKPYVASIDFEEEDIQDGGSIVRTEYYATFAEAVTAANGVEVIKLLQDIGEYTMDPEDVLKVKLNGRELIVSVEGAYVVEKDDDDENVTVYTATPAVASITFVEDDEIEKKYYLTFFEAADAAGEDDVIDLLRLPAETDVFYLTEGKATLQVRKHGYEPNVSFEGEWLLVTKVIEDADNGDITVYSLVKPVAYVDFTDINEGFQYFASFGEAVAAANNVKVITLLETIKYEMAHDEEFKVNKNGEELYVTVDGPYLVNEEEEDGITTYTAVAAVASVTKGETTTYYTDFDDAVAAASNGRFVVELWMDVEQESPYELYVGETLKVKKNGKSFNVKTNYAPWYVFKMSTDEGVTTYSLSERTDAKLVVKPQAQENLTYTALKQNLIIPGVVKGGSLVYSLNPNTGFSETIPAKTEAGEYYVYYRVVPDEQHYSYDYDNEPIEVVIHKATVTPVVTIDGWICGEEPNEPVIEGVVENGEVTFTYAAKGSDEFSAEVPEEAGTYVVKATVEQTPNYMFNDCTAEFSISWGELLLADDSDNSEAIDAAVATGSPYNVVLQGRTLYKDGTWNTLCLPFDLSAEQIAAGPLAGATIMTLDVEAKDGDVYLTRFEDNTLFMHFADADAITAGVPYIVKWAESENVTDPTFEGVVLSTADAVSVTSADEAIAFKGLFAPEGIYSADNNNLYLADDNNLYWPTAEDFTVNAFRAYFQMSTTSEAPVLRSILSFGEGATRINSTSTSTEENWYDLSGRQLNDKPAERGIYIVNGKKVVVK